MNFLERFKLGLDNLKYKYNEWKLKAPEREKERIRKENLNIEKIKRMVKMEEQKAELMKQKSKSAKHISEIRKFSQQNQPKSSEESSENFMSFQPSQSGFFNSSYFTQPKNKKSTERRI